MKSFVLIKFHFTDAFSMKIAFNLTVSMERIHQATDDVPIKMKRSIKAFKVQGWREKRDEGLQREEGDSIKRLI